jgi:arylsulfatase
MKNITKIAFYSLMLIGVVFCQNSNAAVTNRPNIIVIMADDMGYSDLGCYGSEILTPNLDRLASGGLRYTHFYNTGRCCPARASLLTGLYAHQAGIGRMKDDEVADGYRGDLSRNAVTIAEVLKTAGYSTYMLGKWDVTRHIFPESNSDKYNWPLQRGFDRFYGTIDGGGSYFDPKTLTRGNQLITPENDPEYKPGKYYYTHAISDNAVKFIKDHNKSGKGNPFFMYIAYTAPHWPMHALEEDIEKYKGKYDAGYELIRKARYERMKKLGVIKDWKLSPAPQKWEDFPDENRAWEIRCMEVYAAMIDSMDQGIGRVAKVVRESGQLDNTLILFFSDNGGCWEGFGRSPRLHAVTGIKPMGKDELQKDMIPKRSRAGLPVLSGVDVMPGPSETFIAYGRNWANVSNTPFRQYKSRSHEGGIASPMIVHWPKGISAKNELRDQTGHLIDIMATCVDLAKAKYPKKVNDHEIQPMEGQSLASSFESNDPKERLLIWEHFKNAAIRMGKYKLVRLSSKHGKKRIRIAGSWELYDMDKDRSELTDLINFYPEKAKELEALWEKNAHRTKVYPKPGE